MNTQAVTSATAVPVSHDVSPAPRPDHEPDPLRAATHVSLSMAELELTIARLAGENDALRAKCARLSATVDELLSRLAGQRPRAGVAPANGRCLPSRKPTAAPEPTCPHCGSADLRYRHANRGALHCHSCGAVADRPRARRVPGAPPFDPSCACQSPRAATPDACPAHGPLTPENA